MCWYIRDYSCRQKCPNKVDIYSKGKAATNVKAEADYSYTTDTDKGQGSLEETVGSLEGAVLL